MSVDAISMRDMLCGNRQEVLEFIKSFSKAKSTFLFGCCYWFAVILRERFEGSQIVYFPVENHFATQICGRIYDASGDITDEYLDAKAIPWSKMREYDELQYERIVKYCVRKESYEYVS